MARFRGYIRHNANGLASLDPNKNVMVRAPALQAGRRSQKDVKGEYRCLPQTVTVTVTTNKDLLWRASILSGESSEKNPTESSNSKSVPLRRRFFSAFFALSVSLDTGLGVSKAYAADADAACDDFSVDGTLDYAGGGNYVCGEDLQIIGEDNTVVGDNLTVIGEDNTIIGEDGLVIGNGNSVDPVFSFTQIGNLNNLDDDAGDAGANTGFAYQSGNLNSMHSGTDEGVGESADVLFNSQVGNANTISADSDVTGAESGVLGTSTIGDLNNIEAYASGEEAEAAVAGVLKPKPRAPGTIHWSQVLVSTVVPTK
jgi:hypothetical protein